MNKEDEKVLQPKIASREVTMHILKAFGLRMSKKLGQNFLIDARIVQGIVDAAEVKPGDRVLEIGPGIGTLTQGLAEAGADVTAVELDKKLPAVLKETLKAYDNVRIVPGDIHNVYTLKGRNPHATHPCTSWAKPQPARHARAGDLRLDDARRHQRDDRGACG